MTKVNKNINTLNSIEIDSFKMRIPFHQVEVIDYKFVDSITSHYDSTGEHKETVQPLLTKTEKYNEFGAVVYNYKWSIVDQRLQKGISTKYLTIEISSKALEHHYFKAISKHTIKFLYKQLMNENVVSFSLDSFLNAELTDIDFRKDIVNEHFMKAVKTLSNLSKSYKQKNKGCNVFRKKYNQGIEWSDRRKGTISNPFLKLYNKHLMCVVAKSSNSKQQQMHAFYNKFLKGTKDDIQHRIRIEYTLKDKAHLREYDIHSQKLIDLLSLTQEKKNEILEDIVKRHMLPRIAPIQKPKTDLKPLDMMLYTLMCMLLDSTMYGKELIIKTAVKDVHPASRRSEAKNRLENLWDTYIQMRTKAKENEQINDLFSALCWH